MPPARDFREPSWAATRSPTSAPSSAANICGPGGCWPQSWAPSHPLVAWGQNQAMIWGSKCWTWSTEAVLTVLSTVIFLVNSNKVSLGDVLSHTQRGVPAGSCYLEWILQLLLSVQKPTSACTSAHRCEESTLNQGCNRHIVYHLLYMLYYRSII